MLKNFVIVVLRNMRSRGFYSFINISGLALGIMSCLLIMVWVMDEFSYNKFLPKYERLHQVWLNGDVGGGIESQNTVPSPLHKVLKEIDPRIENVAITGRGSEHLLEVEETKILQDGYYVSEAFLEMFEYPILSGQAESAFDDYKSIVLTASTAKALFGNENPMDKLVTLDDRFGLKVTGVIEDVPENSTLQFDYLLPWGLGERINATMYYAKQDWGSNLFYTYVELKEGSSLEEVESTIKDIVKDNYTGEVKRDVFLYPMERWRLYSQFLDGKETGEGLIDYIRLFLIVASLILIIACVNFMNLMTAQSEKASKEVGIRKSLGASRSNLITRFFGESVLATILAFLLALLVTYLVLPYYNNLVEKDLSLDLTSGLFWMVSAGILLLTAFVSGSYPAFYLSSGNSLQSMKGHVAKGKGIFRKVLTVLQLGTAVVLIAWTVILFQQINLMRSKNLGYLKERLITVRYNNELRKNYDVIKQQLIQSGAVTSMTRSSSPITQISHNNWIDWPGKTSQEKVMFATIVTGYDYAKTMGIDILEGRDFSKDFPSDSNAIIFNKAALDMMQLEDPIGTQFDLWGNQKNLIGIIDDVVMENVEYPVRPLFMILEDWGGVATIRLNDQMDIQTALGEVRSTFERLNPAYPFNYKFVDDVFDEKFKSIGLIQKLVGIFTFMAIVITCLGLFGLISYISEQRTREIGIRKVLGASANHVIQLVTKDFVILVLIASVIAGPISWFLLDNFLEKYPLRISVAWWLIPLTSLVTLIITLFIVVSKANKAAKIDPVITLKSE